MECRRSPRWSLLRGSRDVATGEATTKFVRDVHDKERACGRIDHEIARPGDCADQPLDQARGLDMRVYFSIDLLDPAIANLVIGPNALRSCRRRLQRQHVVAASARAITHADTRVVPGDQIDHWQYARDCKVAALAQAIGINPQKAVATWT